MSKKKRINIYFYEDEIEDLQMQDESLANSVRLHLGLKPIKRGKPMSNEKDIKPNSRYMREYRKKKTNPLSG